MKTIVNESKPSIEEACPMKYRYGAILIDYLLIVGYGGILALMFLMFKSFFSELFSSDPVTAQFAGFLLITLPVSLYFVLSEASDQMGTIGKRRFGLKVVDEDGGRIKASTAIIRSVVKFLPWEIAHFAVWRLYLPSNLSEGLIVTILVTVNILLILYVLIPFTNKKRKAIHDLAADTRVISLKE